jgi:hypothetical protein
MAARSAEAAGLYAYGITLAEVECPGATIDEGRVRAVVREEQLDQYEPEALEQALRDRGWLEEQLRAHEAMLAVVLAAGPVLPFRFGTIFRTEDELRALLAASESELVSRLEELRGATEWGVKAWADRRTLHAWVEQHDERAGALRQEVEAAGSPGRRYLLEKRLDRHVTAEAAALALERAHATHALLAAEARDAHTDGPSGLDEAGESRYPVLRGAYLVDEERREAFEKTLAQARREDAGIGLDYALSGPWPPYNFAEPLPTGE